MTDGRRAEGRKPVLDAGTVFRIARQVDPDCAFDAVERYTKEIEEMAAVLATHSAGDPSQGLPFRATWEVEGVS